MARRVSRDLLDLLRQLDELFVLNPRARRTRDDVESGTELRHRDEPSARDVLDYLMADGDLFVLALVGQRERDADGIAEVLREQFLERDAGLDDPVGRQSRLGHSEMERNVGAA